MRCQHVGCTTAARGGKQHRTGAADAASTRAVPRPLQHDGGKRYTEGNCTKSAKGDTGYCVAHGGGKRCQTEDCTKGVVPGDTPHCRAHRGGKRCQHHNCIRLAKAAGSTLRSQCLYAERDDAPVSARHRRSPMLGRRHHPYTDPDYTELMDGFRAIRRMVDENPQAWSSWPK